LSRVALRREPRQSEYEGDDQGVRFVEAVSQNGGALGFQSPRELLVEVTAAFQRAGAVRRSVDHIHG